MEISKLFSIEVESSHGFNAPFGVLDAEFLLLSESVKISKQTTSARGRESWNGSYILRFELAWATGIKLELDSGV